MTSSAEITQETTPEPPPSPSCQLEPGNSSTTSDTRDSSKQATDPALTAPQPRPEASEASTAHWGKWVADLLIICLLSWLVIHLNYSLMRHTIAVPESNFAVHISDMATYDCAISFAPSIWQAILMTLVWPGFYPAGIYTITHFYNLIYGTGVLSSLTSLTVYLPILIASLYYMHRRQDGILMGLCTVMVGFSIPQGFLVCHQFMSDFQVGVGVCVALALLCSCDCFRNRFLTISFGLVFGFAMLFKNNVLWFVAPAVATILIGSWREWRHHWPALLWQLSLMLTAAVVSILWTKRLDDPQEEMVHLVTYFPPSIINMLAMVAVLSLLWWFLAPLSLGKIRSLPMLTNLSQAACLTFCVSMPWLLSSLHLVESQAGVLSSQSTQYLSLEFLKYSGGEIMASSYGALFCLVLVISLLLSFTKWSTLNDKAMMLATLSGLVTTAAFLGNAPRYFLPVFLVSTYCVVAPARRCKSLQIILFLIGLAGAYTALWIPAKKPNELVFSPIYKITHIYPSSCMFPHRPTNRSVFAKTWCICPQLKNPGKGEAQLVAIRRDRSRACRESGYGFDPAEEVYSALRTWGSWHNCELVPIYFSESEHISPIRREFINPLCVLARTSPQTFEVLKGFLARGDLTAETLSEQQTLQSCAHLIDLEFTGMPDPNLMTAEDVAATLGCQPTHRVLQTPVFHIHVWSRPECAADTTATLEDLPANQFIPYLAP